MYLHHWNSLYLELIPFFFFFVIGKSKDDNGMPLFWSLSKFSRNHKINGLNSFQFKNQNPFLIYFFVGNKINLIAFFGIDLFMIRVVLTLLLRCLPKFPFRKENKSPPSKALPNRSQISTTPLTTNLKQCHNEEASDLS